MTVISLPMLLDREVDFVTAMIASVETVRQNPRTMLTGRRSLRAAVRRNDPCFLGLFVVLPVLGHATWHLYRVHRPKDACDGISVFLRRMVLCDDALQAYTTAGEDHQCKRYQRIHAVAAIRNTPTPRNIPSWDLARSCARDLPISGVRRFSVWHFRPSMWLAAWCCMRCSRVGPKLVVHPGRRGLSAYWPRLPRPACMKSAVGWSRRSAGLVRHFGCVVAQKDRQVPSMAMVIMLAFMFWVFVAHTTFALFFGLQPITSSTAEMLLSPPGLTMLAVGSVIGGAMAAMMFALTVISLPLLLDREVDFITAMITSVAGGRQNFIPMASGPLSSRRCCLWRCFRRFLALFLVLPVLGHATWHLYRRLAGDVSAVRTRTRYKQCLKGRGD